MRQPQKLDWLHHLRQDNEEWCAVEGHHIDGSGGCTVVAIRDRKRRGWVLYPRGIAGHGVLLADDAARTLAKNLGRP